MTLVGLDVVPSATPDMDNAAVCDTVRARSGHFPHPYYRAAALPRVPRRAG